MSRPCRLSGEARGTFSGANDFPLGSDPPTAAITLAQMFGSLNLLWDMFSSVHVVVLPVYVFVIFKQSPLRYINHAKDVLKLHQQLFQSILTALRLGITERTMTDANKIKIGKGLDAEGAKAIAVGAAVSATNNADATGTRTSAKPSEVEIGDEAKFKNASGIAIGHAATARSNDT
ncbi:hypothetical protein JOM56_001617 [Amanita muscaria]